MPSLSFLLRRDRYVGCQNFRQYAAPFRKDKNRPLTLYPIEKNKGGICLQLSASDKIVDLETLSLPEHVIERINFWNLWATFAFEHEYEYSPSTYGLEAYAISIAVDIARAQPKQPVDYCGLPIHDDFAICLDLSSDKLWSYTCERLQLTPTCLVPQGIVPNRELKRILSVNPNIALMFRQEEDGFRGWGDFDYMIGCLHFDPATMPYRDSGYDNSFGVHPDDGFPQWLCDKVNEWEISLMDQYYENLRWKSDPILMGFLEDAIAVDVARYHRPLVPIAMSDRYFTAREDVLFLAESSASSSKIEE